MRPLNSIVYALINFARRSAWHTIMELFSIRKRAMNEPTSIIHLDEEGVMRVGKGQVRFDDIVDAYSKKHPPDAILRGFHQ